MLHSQSKDFFSPSRRMATKGTGKDDPVAKRAVRLREAMGYASPGAFAALLGYSPQRWGNVENGHPLSRDIAFKLVQMCPGLTLDWLYLGKADGLPLALASRLGELPSTPGKRTSAPR